MIMEELATALERELAGDVRDDAYTRHLYAADASMFAVEPLAVAFPRDADDVAAAMSVSRAARRADRAARRRHEPRRPDGRRARAGARPLAPHGRDRRGRRGARRVRVEPGVVQEELNRAAKRFGLGFGPDTSTSNRATLGGMIGNNSSGQRVDRPRHDDRPRARARGRARRRLARHVLGEGADARDFDGAIHDGVRDVLRDHARAIAEDYPKHWRQSGGYRLDRLDPFDLAKLVVGSEGTLAIVTAATVRLVELPKAKMFAVGHFDSLLGAIEATDDALALEPAAVEMIDRMILGALARQARVPRARRPARGRPGARCCSWRFAGDTEDEVRDKLDRERGGTRHGYHFLRAETAAEQAALTKVRKAGLGLLMAASEGRTRPAAFVEDTAVAPERLHDYVARFQEIFAATGSRPASTGTARSAACTSARSSTSRDPARSRRCSAVASEVVDLVAEFDGVNSSEHGDGRIRSPFNPRIFGDELYGAMREVKRPLRPGRRAQPGRDGRRRAAAAHIRDAEYPQPKPLETHFRFPEGSMHAAADRCQRIGACRKAGSGVMCPSYMATREEEHATRGRANALVKALSRPTPRPRSATSGCTRSSTSASSARRARASARCRSTWRR